ncbi:MAG: hypothetical protein AB1671_04080 [Thermodesulfobacteriota bacterium]
MDRYRFLFISTLLLVPTLLFGHDEDPAAPLTDEDVMIRSDEPEKPIGGIPYEDARAIFFAHKPALERTPGVEAVALGDESFVVYADEHAQLPLALGGLTVRRVPPMDPPVNGRPATEVRRIFERHRASFESLPRVQGIGLGPEGILVYTDRPEQLPPTVEGVPVVAREPMGMPINGIPVMEVEEIYARAQVELMKIEGVYAVRMGYGGITKDGPDDRAGVYVWTSIRGVAPAEFEGVPIFEVYLEPRP